MLALPNFNFFLWDLLDFVCLHSAKKVHIAIEARHDIDLGRHEGILENFNPTSKASAIKSISSCSLASYNRYCNCLHFSFPYTENPRIYLCSIDDDIRDRCRSCQLKQTSSAGLRQAIAHGRTKQNPK